MTDDAILAVLAMQATLEEHAAMNEEKPLKHTERRVLFELVTRKTYMTPADNKEMQSDFLATCHEASVEALKKISQILQVR
jgi:hypothetical protein